jgi:hypothetical protein
MAGKKDAKQRAGPRDRIERAKKRNPGEPEKEPQRDPGEQEEPKRSSLTKRRQARKVATMVKRLRKNPEDLEQQPKAEAEAEQVSEGGWDARQQATVAPMLTQEECNPRRCCKPLSTRWKKPCAKRRVKTRQVRLCHSM